MIVRTAEYPMSETTAESSEPNQFATAAITRGFEAENEYLSEDELQELELRTGHSLPKDLRRHSPLFYSFLLERKVEKAERLTEEEIRTYRLAAKGLIKLSDEEIQQRLSASLAAVN